MSRPRHPDAHIEKAVQYAEALGWRVLISNGHAWGCLLCPHHRPGGCIVNVWSTPRVPISHARYLRKRVDTCPHKANENGEEDTDE